MAAEIERRSIASIRPTDALRLVDLTGDGPLIMGVPYDVVGARQPDGVLYPSRLNEERRIALYGRVIGKLDAIASPRLLECGAELAAILDDQTIAIG